MTPLQINIVLHYYVHADDFRDGDFSAPAVREAIDWMRGEAGLLELELEHGTARTYRLTDRGLAFVAALCAMPLPVQQWVTPPTTPAT